MSDKWGRTFLPNPVVSIDIDKRFPDLNNMNLEDDDGTEYTPDWDEFIPAPSREKCMVCNEYITWDDIDSGIEGVCIECRWRCPKCEEFKKPPEDDYICETCRG